MITVGQLVEWVKKHRGDKVFRGYTDEELVASISEAANENTLFYEASEDGTIHGMVYAMKMEKIKVLFVQENLATDIKILGRIARLGRAMYPGYRIEAQRHGKLRKFNTDKLYTKLGAI